MRAYYILAKSDPVIGHGLGLALTKSDEELANMLYMLQCEHVPTAVPLMMYIFLTALIVWRTACRRLQTNFMGLSTQADKQYLYFIFDLGQLKNVQGLS
ncbi:hypothetical protein AHF37_00533 [Paragonimus kellicotti]|nr:hypothetical protein AHF37_00533 [Paragonimus kellicotti]